MTDEFLRFRTPSWCDLVIARLDQMPVPDRKPALVLQLALDAPPEARAVLLAEYWHLLMIGARHNSRFVFSVALDVWGQALSTPRSCLAETLAAAARRVPEGSPWLIRTYDDPTDDEHNLARAALRGLIDIPKEFDFVAGWGLVQLRTLLAKAGLHQEALVVAQRLSNHLGARSDTLRRLTEREGSERPGIEGIQMLGGQALGGQVLGNSAIRRTAVPCDFGPGEQKVPVYLGRPAEGYHPLHFQNALIRATHGGSIQPEVMAKLYSL